MIYRFTLLTILVLLLVTLEVSNIAIAASPATPIQSDAISNAALLEKAKKQIDQNHQIVLLLLAMAAKQVDATNTILKQNMDQTNHTGESALDDAFLHEAADASATIGIIGQFHDESAVPFLLEHLLFTNNNVMPNHSRRAYFPCLGALTDIGSPAIEPIIEKIKVVGIQVPAQGAIAATAVIHIIGKPAAIACIQDAISKTTTTSEHQNLADWLAIVQSMPDGKVN